MTPKTAAIVSRVSIRLKSCMHPPNRKRSSQSNSQIADIALCQRREERHFRRQFLPQRGGVKQSLALQQIEENLAVRAHFRSGPDGPVNRLGQAGVVDEGAVLLRERRG